MTFHHALSLPGIPANKASVRAAPSLCMDEEAFHVLYGSVAPALQGYIRKTCSNASLAEDILQETFYRFLRADLPKMDAHQTKSYLFKIATSLLVDHWRRERREKLWKNLWHPPAVTQGGQGSDVSQALSALKPAERALLWMAYVEGFDHGEIAAAMGLSEKSIRVLLFRARKNMARILGRRDVISWSDVMNRISCPHEETVSNAARTGCWDDSTRAHVRQCAHCREIAGIAEWMGNIARVDIRDAVLPGPERVYLKATNRRDAGGAGKGAASPGDRGVCRKDDRYFGAGRPGSSGMVWISIAGRKSCHLLCMCRNRY